MPSAAASVFCSEVVVKVRRVALSAEARFVLIDAMVPRGRTANCPALLMPPCLRSDAEQWPQRLEAALRNIDSIIALIRKQSAIATESFEFLDPSLPPGGQTI